MNYVTRYYLGIKDLGEFECDKKKWVEAERACGFRPRYGRPDSEPCTGGFSSGPFTGRMAHEKVPDTVPTEPALDRVKDLAGRTWTEGQPF